MKNFYFELYFLFQYFYSYKSGIIYIGQPRGHAIFDWLSRNGLQFSRRHIWRCPTTGFTRSAYTIFPDAMSIINRKESFLLLFTSIFMSYTSLNFDFQLKSHHTYKLPLIFDFCCWLKFLLLFLFLITQNKILKEI